jgi:hypothetical protein
MGMATARWIRTRRLCEGVAMAMGEAFRMAMSER